MESRWVDALLAGSAIWESLPGSGREGRAPQTLKGINIQ